MKVETTVTLKHLSREELLELFSRVAPLVRESDLLWARWNVLARKAQRIADASLEGPKPSTHAEFSAASKAFDRAMRLWERADETYARMERLREKGR